MRWGGNESNRQFRDFLIGIACTVRQQGTPTLDDYLRGAPKGAITSLTQD
jgi:hypothetical protein